MPWINQPQVNGISAATVILSSIPQGRGSIQWVGFIPQTQPSGSGILTFNDCTSLGQASLANQLFSLAVGAATSNGVALFAQIGANALNLTAVNGLVVSSVPPGVTLSVVYALYFPNA